MKHSTANQQPVSGIEHSGNEPRATSQKLTANSKKNKEPEAHSPKHIQATRAAQATQLSQVCHYLGWSKQQYCNHQFATYTAFLTQMFLDYPNSFLRDAEYSPVMRGFFNNEWAKRNNQFLPYASALCFTGIEVTSNGDMQHCYGLPLGCDALLSEYIGIHSITEMLDSSHFMNNYNTALKLAMYGK